MPTPKTKLTDRKRAAIIQAAAEEFQAQGYQSTSMDRIAARAEVSKRTVYNHFPSKDELFLAIAAEVWQRGVEATKIEFDPKTPVAKQLTRVGEQKLKLLATPDYMGLMRVMLAECIRSPELAREVFGQVQAEDDQLVGWLKAANAAGCLRVPKPAAAAEQFWALVKGPVMFPLLLGLDEAPSARKRKSMVKQAVEVFLSYYGVG